VKLRRIFVHLQGGFSTAQRWPQLETRLDGCMVCISARQNFDDDAMASSRKFNSAMV